MDDYGHLPSLLRMTDLEKLDEGINARAMFLRELFWEFIRAAKQRLGIENIESDPGHVFFDAERGKAIVVDPAKSFDVEHKRRGT